MGCPTFGIGLCARKRAVMLTAIVALAAEVCSCATLEVVPPKQLHGQQLAPNTQPVGHIYADNWGWYLFKYIPLVTGSLDRPGSVAWPAFFSNQVTLQGLVDKVSQESARRGGTVVTDLRTRDRSAWVPETFILWLNEYEASANASKPLAPDEAQAPPSPEATDLNAPSADEVGR